MGVLVSGAKATDGCCTMCCVGIAGLAGVAVVATASAIASPVTIPISIKRTKTYAKYLSEYVSRLAPNDARILQRELGLSSLENLSHKHFYVWFSHMKSKKYEGLNEKKVGAFPVVLGKNVLLCSVPPKEELFDGLHQFMKEIRRQSTMTQEDIQKEQMADLQMFLGQFRA